MTSMMNWREDWRTKLTNEVNALIRTQPEQVKLTLSPYLARPGRSGMSELPSWDERSGFAVRLLRERGYELEHAENVLWFFGRKLVFRRSVSKSEDDGELNRFEYEPLERITRVYDS